MLEWLNKDIQTLHPQSDVVLSLGASYLFRGKSFPLRLTPFDFPQYILQIFQSREVLGTIYGEDALLLFCSVRDISHLIPVALAHLSNSAFRAHFFNSISTPLAAALETAFQTNTSTSSFTQTAEDTSRVDEAGQKLRKREIEEVDGKLATGEHKRVRLFSEGSGRSSISFPPSPKHLPLQTIEDATVPASSLLTTPTKPELDSLPLPSSPLASSSPILPVEEDNLFFADFELIPPVSTHSPTEHGNDKDLFHSTQSEPNNPSTLAVSHPRPYQCEDSSLAIPQSPSGIPAPFYRSTAPFYRSTAPTPSPTRQTWDSSSPEAPIEAQGERTLLDISEHLNWYNNTYTPNPQSIEAFPHSGQRASRAPSFEFATLMSQAGTDSAVSSSMANPSSLAASNRTLSVNPTVPPTLPIGPQPTSATLTKTKSLPLPLPLPPTPGSRGLRHVQPLPQPPQSTPRSHFRHLIESKKASTAATTTTPSPFWSWSSSHFGSKLDKYRDSAESQADSAPAPLPAPSAFDLLPPGSESPKLPPLPTQVTCSPPPLPSKSTQSNLDPECLQQTPSFAAFPPPGITHCAQSPQPENPRERPDLQTSGFVLTGRLNLPKPFCSSPTYSLLMSLPDAKDLQRCFVDELISRNQQAQNAKDIEPFIPDRGIGLGDPQYLANQLDIGEENMLEWINNDVQAFDVDSSK
ncbi:hypothetical protein D9757_004491 [Collybiopsis confluens]|uniref:Uncharacterized protein n=1 Tax=Collybiopsis confluens TaxID=2823264 RepID=A0A8H5HWT1_9AGAR|nr:hypothetical protein D9757_004491 [Collybiopsis confluens]